MNTLCNKKSRGFSRFVFSLLLISLSLAVFSCASTPKKTYGSTGDAYYDNNIGDFSVSALNNAIPLIFKKSENEVISFNLMISGGSSLLASSQSGLEDLTLKMIVHGSQSYPYQMLQQLFYEKSFGLAPSCGKEYSILSTSCLKKDLEDVIPVLADAFLNPSFVEEDFDNLITDEKERLVYELSDPSGILSLELAKAAYENHPYDSTPSARQETIDLFTLDDLKAHHQSLLNAGRLSFVVVGNLSAKDQKKIEDQLNELFSSLPAPSENGDNSFTPASIPPLEVSGSTVYAECPTAQDTAYIAGYYAVPPRGTDEYVAYAIATMYLDDLFFANVREKYGAVYSIGSGAIGASQLLGIHSVFKATEKENLQKYIYEAIDAFPSEAELAEKLENYKNKYITILFSSSQNASGLARNIINSLAYQDSPSEFLNRSRQVQSVTAGQVYQAYAKYIAQNPDRALDGKVNPIRWIVVSGPEAVKDFRFE